MRMQDKAIQDMLKAYPGLEYTNGNQEDIFQGTIIINHLEEKSNVLLTGEFGIKIVVNEQYPGRLPEVYDINNSIDKTYVHRYPNGELCLESITRLKLFCINHSVKEFIDLFLINYLYSYLYFERYLIYPNGERPHDLDGEYDFLREYFNVPLEKVPIILKYILDCGIKRNDLCPCGSGKHVKRCHGKNMIELQNGIKKSGIEKLFFDLVKHFLEGKG